jgi:Lon protease-like protein
MEGESGRLPLFPLDNVVLFPGLDVPLHIFEPRYRQLTEHVLQGDRRIGMVATRPEARPASAGRPALFDVGCCGLVRRFERLPDGRFNLVLAGQQRFRIVEEPPGTSNRLYRVARIETLEEAPPGDAENRAGLAELRRTVRDQIKSLIRLHGSNEENALGAAFLDRVDDAQFVHSLCLAIDFDVRDKQGLLECHDLHARAERLEELLTWRLAERLHGAPGADTVH